MANPTASANECGSASVMRLSSMSRREFQLIFRARFSLGCIMTVDQVARRKQCLDLLHSSRGQVAVGAFYARAETCPQDLTSEARVTICAKIGCLSVPSRKQPRLERDDPRSEWHIRSPSSPPPSPSTSSGSTKENKTGAYRFFLRPPV